jgi:hypothetical protein
MILAMSEESVPTAVRSTTLLLAQQLPGELCRTGGRAQSPPRPDEGNICSWRVSMIDGTSGCHSRQ